MKYIAFLLLFLVACTLPQPAVTVDDNIAEKADTAEDEVIESSEAVETIEESKQKAVIIKSGDAEETETVESSPITSASVIETDEKPPVKKTLSLTPDTVMDWLVEVFAQDVKSYQFFISMGKVFVRGDKFKILLSTPLRYLSEDKETGSRSQDTITSIYVDRDKKTATGYCEGFETGLRRECETNDLLDVARTLNFLEYNIKLPEDWLWELLEQKPNLVETDKYYINSKKTVRVFFSINEKDSDVFFDEKTGLPVRLISEKDGKTVTYDFKDLSANSVKENDVIHRDLDDIPSSEYFE